jgi:hypothetical protein
MSVVPELEREAERPERWSAKAKVDVVLRLLRGESVDAVSREVQVPAYTNYARSVGVTAAPSAGGARPLCQPPHPHWLITRTTVPAASTP